MLTPLYYLIRRSATYAFTPFTEVCRSMKECPICNKQVDERGFGGHMFGVHGIRIGTRATIEDLQKRLEKTEEEIQKIRQFLMDFRHQDVSEFLV